jgi:muramidase (phage lysozyme)
MVSSTLNPQAITKSRPATPDSFGSFMTGENNVNSSSFADAANKVVSFSRPNAAPVSSNISSVVSNISTNILNQVDNSLKNTTNFIKTDFENEIGKLRNEFLSKLGEVQANTNELQKDVIKTTNEIQQQVLTQKQSQATPETPISGIQGVVANIQEQAKNVVDNILKSFSQDYQQKIKGFDDNRPNNVLSKFLDLYQNAIGFVNFFGDRKNINTVEKNLKSLRVMFEESFEVAKVLRQTIVKIVKQLSNLPSASPSAGGLNLDVNVPGGRLKQAGGPSVRNVGRGAGLGAAAGIGLLGLGGVAAAASGMGKAKQYQEEMLASGVEGAPMGQSIPEGFIDTFSSIVDRFTSAIEGLVKGAKSSPGSSGGGGGGGGPSPSPSPSGGGAVAGSTSMEGTTGPQGKATNALLDTIAFAEGTSNKPNKGYNTHFGGSQTQDLSKHPDKVIHTPRYSSAAFGRYQFMPNTWGSVGGGAMTPDRQDAGAVRLTIKRLNAAGIAVKDATELETLLQKEGMSPRISAALSPEWASFPTLSGNSFYGQPVKKLSDMQDVYKKQLGSQPTTTTAATPTTPGGVVAAAPAQTQMQTRAQAISQPAQKVPQTISLSPTIIDASSPQQEQQQSGGVSAPPPSGGGSIEVPMLPTTNPDNFLTMYSRIVYNIVDG